MSVRGSAGNLFVGIIIVVVGVYFLADNWGWIPRGIQMSRFWPVLLILFGMWIIFGDRMKR